MERKVWMKGEATTPEAREGGRILLGLLDDFSMAKLRRQVEER